MSGVSGSSGTGSSVLQSVCLVFPEVQKQVAQLVCLVYLEAQEQAAQSVYLVYLEAQEQAAQSVYLMYPVVQEQAAQLVWVSSASSSLTEQDLSTQQDRLGGFRQGSQQLAGCSCLGLTFRGTMVCG